MDKLYACVFWDLDENKSFSCVKISKILYDSQVHLQASDLVGNRFQVKLNKSSSDLDNGNVLEIGMLNLFYFSMCKN